MDFTVSAPKTKREKEYRLQTIAIVGGVCFFIGRACFMEGLAPVGASLLATLAFYNVHRLGNWQKAIIAGSIVITGQSVFYIVSESQCSINEILVNGGITVIFCIIFDTLILLWKKTSMAVGHDMVMLSAAATAMLMVIGIGVPWLNLPAAAIFAAFSGYLLGLAEGVLVSFASGMLLLLCGQTPLHILWLLLTGAAAGSLKENGRTAAGLATATIAVLSGCFQMLPAAVLLVLLPEFLIIQMEVWIRKHKLPIPKEADKNLRELSLLFASLDNPKSRMAYEFKAILQLCQHGTQSAGKRRRKTQKPAAAGYAGTGERSGDSCTWAALPDGTFALALSDGMGKGTEAGQESSLAATSVIKLLKAGLEPELVLKLLNSILMMDRTREQFPTMDLGILDPEQEEMYFYKIGAAPTMIKRSTGIEILDAPAMPMGVMEADGFRCLSTIVHPGDQIVMMTDGIVDSRREDLELNWLKKLMSQMKTKDPQTISDLIIREAAENYGQREKDDMTVISLVVR